MQAGDENPDRGCSDQEVGFGAHPIESATHGKQLGIAEKRDRAISQGVIDADFS